MKVQLHHCKQDRWFSLRVSIKVLSLYCRLPDSGQRMQISVQRLLDMIVDQTQQLQDSQSTQRNLATMLETRVQEVQEMTGRVEDLELRLRSEVEGKDYLARELNKAEG